MPDSFVMILRRITAGGLAGATVGVLVSGIGGRMAMRVAAMLSPDATGRLTEAGERVGEITLNGSLAVLLFGGLFGGFVAGVIWIAIADWVPGTGRRRLLIAGAISAAIGGALLIRSGNIDFRVLDGDAAIITIFLVLAALTGIAVAVMDGALLRRLPRPTGAARAQLLGYGAMTLLGLFLAAPLALGAFFSTDGCGCSEPQRLVGIALFVAGGATIAGWVQTAAPDGSGPSAMVRRAGMAGLAAATLLGAVRVVSESARILGAG